MGKKYNEYKKLDLPAIGEEIKNYWEQNTIFSENLSIRKGNKPFIFYEGPPSANGVPGIHHVMARTIKDIVCRFKSLKGFYVERKGGWDTHGLPVEIQVEKLLGITKEDIGKSITIEEYNKVCRREVMKYKDVWDEITRKIGYWLDLENPYITFDNKYIESVWNLLQKLFDKGLLYKGYTIQPYSPAAGTGLSTHELNMPGCYRNVKDTTVVAKFKIVKNKKYDNLFNTNKDVYFLAWTTTPWTLPSNTALAVGKNIEYILVSSYNNYNEEIYYVIAKSLFNKYFTTWIELTSTALLKGISSVLNFVMINERYHEITNFSNLTKEEINAIQQSIKNDLKIHRPLGFEINSYTGSDLLEIRYEQLMPYALPEDGDPFRVVAGDFVSTEDGTGIVHIAPSFGADDFRMNRLFNVGA